MNVLIEAMISEEMREDLDDSKMHAMYFDWVNIARRWYGPSTEIHIVWLAAIFPHRGKTLTLKVTMNREPSPQGMDGFLRDMGRWATVQQLTSTYVKVIYLAFEGQIEQVTDIRTKLSIATTQ